jgi:Outer membrane protein beta-barrel domain
LRVHVFSQRGFSMRVHVYASAAMLALVSMPASSQTGYPMFQPSISVGYIYDGHTDVTFKNATPSALGVTRIEKTIQNDPGWYVGVDVPVKLNDRFGLAVGGRWDASTSDKSSLEVYNNGVARRDWEADSRKWHNAYVSLSYAFYRNPSVSLSAMAGLRWDRHNVSFGKPVNTLGILSSITNTADFNMTNFSPVIGIDAVFAGPRSGMWGGPIKLSLSGSPFVKTDVEHDETFGPAAFVNLDADSSNDKYIRFAAEATVLNFKAGTSANGALSIVADYTRFDTNGSAKSTQSMGGGGAVFASRWDYSTRASEATIGLKAALSF